LHARLSGYIADLKATLAGETRQAQALLRRLIRGRLEFSPQKDGSYRFTGNGTVEPVLSGLILIVASPTRPIRYFPTELRRRLRTLA